MSHDSVSSCSADVTADPHASGRFRGA